MKIRTNTVETRNVRNYVDIDLDTFMNLLRKSGVTLPREFLAKIRTDEHGYFSNLEIRWGENDIVNTSYGR